MNKTSFFASREALEQAIKKDRHLIGGYANLHGEWKQRFVDYMLGKKTLPLTYDPFFKRIFNPDIHPERLNELISSIIGQRVTVEAVLPCEDIALSVDSLLIMDIIVRLDDGSIANVEIQKIPYNFPAERISCYSSDLLLRQYNRLKMNDSFKYSDMKKVYTIVIYETTSPVFHEDYLMGAYYHHGKTTFDSGLHLELLQEYFLIALDVFSDKDYADNGGELDKWLSLLSVESVDDAELLIKKYPQLEDIFVEMSEYITNPEEVISMFSEALKIMDSNTVKYMMDELSDELADTKSELLDIKNKLSTTENKLSTTENKLSTTENKLSTTESKLISTIIQMTKEYSGTKEQAKDKLMKECEKTEEEAIELVEYYWR